MDKLAEMLANAAELDLGLPFSLIMDAWDIMGLAAVYGNADEPGKVAAMRQMFLDCLKKATQTFDADQQNYRFNDKAL